jgi:peroxiredoxin
MLEGRLESLIARASSRVRLGALHSFVVLASCSLTVACTSATTRASSHSSTPPKPANSRPLHALDVSEAPPGATEPTQDTAVERRERGDASASEPPRANRQGRRGWLGIELAETERSEPGVLVRHVFRGSPAEGAGLLAGDVILKVDGNDVTAPGDVQRLVAAHKSGERVSIALRRASNTRLFAVELAALPTDDDMLRLSFVGAPAPEFQDLKTAQGSLPATVGALRGRVVVIEFFAQWCQICRLLVPKMNELRARLGAQGVEVVGITMDPVSTALRSATEQGMAYTVASDESGETSRAYRALALPTVFVIDRKGVVRDVMVGYSTQKLSELSSLVDSLVAAR